MQNQNKPIKLAIVGNQGVGKTTLILRVAEKKFCQNVNCGVAVDFRSVRDYKVNGQSVNLNIFDVAGLARNSDLALSFIKDASAIVLAFSLQDIEYYAHQQNEKNENLLTQIQHWTIKIFENCHQPNTPVLIVGCKHDLVSDKEKLIPAINEELEKILIKCPKINIITNKKKNMIFFPTSSASGKGIEELFNVWVKEACKLPQQDGISLLGKPEQKQKEKNDQCC